MVANGIEKDIRAGKFHNSYLICGEEDYLRRTYRDLLLSKVTTPGDDLNFTRIVSENPDPGMIIDLAETLPFMARYRVILIEDSGFFTGTCDKLASYISNINESAILIFNETNVRKNTKMYTAVKNNGIICDMEMLSDKDLWTWLSGRIKESGLSITRNAWQEFLGRTKSSMDLMSNEMNKLISYCSDKKTIEYEDVCLMTSGISEEQIFSVIDAIAERDIEKTMGLYRTLLDNRTDPIGFISAVVTTFRRTAAMRNMQDEHLDYGSIAKRMNIDEWKVKKNLGKVRNFSTEELNDLLLDAADLETDAKTGRVDPEIGVETLFIKYCCKKITRV